METMKPALLLFPNLLGEHKYHEPFLPASIDKAVATIDGLIAESEQGGRRFLGRFSTKKAAKDIPIAIYDKHSTDKDLDFLLEPLQKGERWGFVSDAGLPCIADPGDRLVRRARQTGIMIQAFVGPSAILLALMQSGLSGQNFTFHGYLDANQEKRQTQILKLEKLARQEGYTQIFMETPYRNKHVLESLLEILQPETWLCVAWDLTLPTQGILSQPVAFWKKSPLPNLDKKNAIFLLNV